MSTETPLLGGDLAGLVSDETITEEDVQSTLRKIGFAIKQKAYVYVALHQSVDSTVVKVYPLEQKQAEYLNHRDGQERYIAAKKWKEAYDANPLSSNT